MSNLDSKPASVTFSLSRDFLLGKEVADIEDALRAALMKRMAHLNIEAVNFYPGKRAKSVLDLELLFEREAFVEQVNDLKELVFMIREELCLMVEFDREELPLLRAKARVKRVLAWVCRNIPPWKGVEFFLRTLNSLQEYPEVSKKS